MRCLRRLGIPALLTLLVGCGNHDLVLRVDILSFTRELQSTVPVAAPAVPGGFATGEQALVADQEVNLVEGIGDAVTVKDVSLRIQTVATGITGSGTDTLRVYAGDSGTPPRSNAPVLTQILTFAAGTSDTATTLISQNAQLIQLFAGSSLRVAITTSARGPTAGSALSGTLRVTAMDAVVVTGRKL